MMLAGCFTVAWLVHLLIWLVVLVAVVAILRIIIPWALGAMGITAPLVQVMNIIIGAIVIIAILLFIVDLLACLRV